MVGGNSALSGLSNEIVAVDIEDASRRGVAAMPVTGLGKDTVRDARYFGLATRIAVEIDANCVMNHFIEQGFDRVVAGVDMGRNILQADDPVAMIRAVGKVVLELQTRDRPLQMHTDFKSRGARQRQRDTAVPGKG